MKPTILTPWWRFNIHPLVLTGTQRIGENSVQANTGFHMRFTMNTFYTLAVHGGAGTIKAGHDPAAEAPYHAALKGAICAGEDILASGGSALDSVIAAVRVLEDCPLFNAARGSVYNADALHEMDASVMDGRTLAAGAVAGIRTVRNPVLLARAVMEQSTCVLLAGEGAERFARERGFETSAAEYFATPERLEQLLRVRSVETGTMLDHDAVGATGKSREPIDSDTKFGTVGAVARDRFGNLAAAVSTGGMTNKRPGRIGDSPVIGAGIYADNHSVAVAATGTGEHFMRTVASYDVAARMTYAGESLEQAAHHAIFERLDSVGGRGGLIAIDKAGNLVMPFNTTGMYRGWVREGDAIATAISAGPPVLSHP
jgi:beta-aspartyl-peptidase (threonine type)